MNKRTTSKIDRLRIGRENDQRIKLTQKDKDEIISLYNSGEYTRRELAEKFNIHYSYIRVIVVPGALEQVQEINKRNRHKYKRTRDYAREYQRSFRERKKELLKRGVLTNKD